MRDSKPLTKDRANEPGPSEAKFPAADSRMGAEIRKLRKARGLPLSSLASAIGRSISYVSQIERGNAEPSISDLKGIAKVLEVPVGWFFFHDEAAPQERGRIVRASSRRRLGAPTTGQLEELLSPDIGGAFEMFLSTFEPGSASETSYRRATEEEGYVVQGAVELWIGEDRYLLNAGDSFRIVDEPLRWRNPGTVDAVIVWVISPPTY